MMILRDTNDVYNPSQKGNDMPNRQTDQPTKEPNETEEMVAMTDSMTW